MRYCAEDPEGSPTHRASVVFEERHRWLIVVLAVSRLVVEAEPDHHVTQLGGVDDRRQRQRAEDRDDDDEHLPLAGVLEVVASKDSEQERAQHDGIGHHLSKSVHLTPLSGV